MGTLTYSELSIRVLSPDIVLAMGNSSSGARQRRGEASGRFTLVIARRPRLEDHPRSSS